MKTETIPVRVEARLKKELTKLAFQNRRTLSDYIRVELIKVVEKTRNAPKLF